MNLTLTVTEIWLILMIVFAAVEGLTLGLTTIWFAAGAFVALILSFFDVSVPIQIIVFIIVSLVMLIFTRKIFVDRLKTGRTRTNVESIPGKKGIVTADIGNLDSGRVRVDAQEWAARSEDGSKLLVGEEIRVIRVEGVTLIVRMEK